jgi:hypothetical protein
MHFHIQTDHCNFPKALYVGLRECTFSASVTNCHITVQLYLHSINVMAIHSRNILQLAALNSFLSHLLPIEQRCLNIRVRDSNLKALYFHLTELKLDVASCNRIIKHSWPHRAAANQRIAPVTLLKLCSW